MAERLAILARILYNQTNTRLHRIAAIAVSGYVASKTNSFESNATILQELHINWPKLSA